MQTQSLLTRRVFLALQRGRPCTFANCQRRGGNHASRQARPSVSTQVQRRSIFGMSFKAAPRGLEGAKNTPGNLEIALGRLVDLVRAHRSQSKAPAPDAVVEALRFLFRSHLETPRRFSRNEIFLASEAFKHLNTLSAGQSNMDESAFSKADVGIALQSLALARGEENFRSDTSALANMLFKSLQADRTSNRENHPPSSVDAGEESLQTYITVLASVGNAREARKMLRNLETKSGEEDKSLGIAVVKGLFSEGLEKEAWQTLTEVQDSMGNLDPASHERMTIFLASRDNINATKRAYEIPIEADSMPTTSCRLAMINLCTRHKQFDWSKQVLKSLLPMKDDPKVVNTVLVWHAAQGVTQPPEVTLRAAMESMNLSERDLTMTNFNHLIDYAYSVDHPGAAKLYTEMATKVGLHPDSQTYLLQLAYQLKTADLVNARQSYGALSSVDVPTDGSDLPVLNKFLAELCFAPNPDMDLIMHLVDGLLDRNVDLDAETVAGLCHVFLQKDDLQEVMGLLRHRADSYPAADRARISAIFQTFILDPRVNDQRAYNAYELFKAAFAETSVEVRLKLMTSFFDRNRSDLACLVFGHMRQREDPEARPTSEAYAQCFEGIARCKDVDGLQMVFNMLKLDLEVEQTTRVHNACMAAYTACQMPFTAIIDHFWKIMDSREGPTLSSFALALRACETWVPQGSQEARRIIALMQSWQFDITKEIYHCYIGALAGQSEFENTVELIEEMERDVGESPDAVTLGTFYNAIPWQFRKDEVEAWAKQAYPDQWEDLVAHGDEVDEEFEVRYFKIDRSIDLNDEPLFAEGAYDPQIAHESQIMLEAPNR